MDSNPAGRALEPKSPLTDYPLNISNGYLDEHRAHSRAGTVSPRSLKPTISTHHAQAMRNSAQPATSPLRQPSPLMTADLRRSSSAASFNSKPVASPSLKKRGSRSSLHAQAEDGEKRPTPKRSISNLIAGLRETHSKTEIIEEPKPLNASDIALEHFARELAKHDDAPIGAEVVVILHDSCYGHRFSRLKTSKSLLSFIVERPERILASALGVSAAYVRLGEHHAGGKNAPHPKRQITTPPSFRIRRTLRSMDLMSQWVTAVHGTSWMSELKNMCDSAEAKLALGTSELIRPPDPSHPDKQHLHEGDLYLCPGSREAFQGALGGVADAIDEVFDSRSITQRAFVAIRPPGHHCSADFPSGFCWLNNVHVGIEYAAQMHGLTHAAILDFDLHHGDGSQAITWEQNSKNNLKRLGAKSNSKLKLGPDIGYFSIHDINSYPCESGDDEKVQAASLCIDDAHGQSIWNVHLQPWRTEAEFWQHYELKYQILLEKASGFLGRQTARVRAEGKVQPKAAIFISAGFDASEWESSGMQRHKVNVPTEFYARFTQDTVKIAQQASSGCQGRVISVLEGGYSDRALCSGTLSHLAGLCTSSTEHAKTATTLDQLMEGLAIETGSDLPKYDRAWWSPQRLDELELKVNPPPVIAQGKKVRTGPQPTYATPTESFAYKVVDTDKFARSISGTMREVARPARPPTPPPPEVNWVVATQELLRCLVPTDRTTKSCTSEELGGTKIKKEQQNITVLPPTEEPANSRQLRDRKSKVAARIEGENGVRNDSSAVSGPGFNRRQTIADLPSTTAAEPIVQRRASRRLSASSALSSVSDKLDSAIPPVPTIPARNRVTSGSTNRTITSNNDLGVKKSRAPAPMPAKSAQRTVPPASKPSVPLGAKTAQGLPAAPVALASGDIDTLTSGMKKVTLKVGTRDEHDRKQKEKVDAERRLRALKGAETRRINAAAKKAAASQNNASNTITSTQTAAPATGTSNAGAGVPEFKPEVSAATNGQHVAPAEVASIGILSASSSPPAIYQPTELGTMPPYQNAHLHDSAATRARPELIEESYFPYETGPLANNLLDVSDHSLHQPMETSSPSDLIAGVYGHPIDDFGKPDTSIHGAATPQDANGCASAYVVNPIARPTGRESLTKWTSMSAIPFATADNLLTSVEAATSAAPMDRIDSTMDNEGSHAGSGPPTG